MLRSLFKGVFLIVLLGYAGIVLYMSSQETALLYPGSSRSKVSQFARVQQSGLRWDTLRVSARDGVPVFLLESRLNARSNTPWAIYIHGNGGVVGEDVTRYQFLQGAGFNVLAVEFRGYGQSFGVAIPSEEGLYLDGLAAWTYLTKDLRIDPRNIVVYGWSLGGGVATYLATEVKLAGLITEATFTSIPNVAKIHFPWLPVSLVMDNQFDNLSRARNIDIPWLIFHGTGDDLIPILHGEQLNQLAPKATFIPLTGGHGPVYENQDVALAHIRTFARKLPY